MFTRSPGALRIAVAILVTVSSGFVSSTWAIEPIVYVSRSFESVPQADRRASAVERATDGILYIKRDGEQPVVLVNEDSEPVTGTAPLDVSDPSVSYDAQRIVFAGYSPVEEAWRIYEVGVDGSGLRQLTTSDREEIDLTRYGEELGGEFATYDDLDPCYLPDGRICFVSTRYPGSAPGGRVRATNLYVANADGTDVHRITTERFGADTPAVDPMTGQIVYSRWWLTEEGNAPPTGGLSPTSAPPYYGPVTNTALSTIPLRGLADPDFVGVNNWSLSSVNPDGTGLQQFSGSGLLSELTMAYRPAFFEDGRVTGLFIRQSPFLGYPGSHGIRMYSRGIGYPEAVAGPQSFFGSAVPADPNPLVFASFTEPRFAYGSAEPLADGNLLVTGHPWGNGDGSPADFDVYVQTRRSNSPVGAPLVNSNRMLLDAVPVYPRDVPPIIEDEFRPEFREDVPQTVEEAIAMHGTFKFVCENIHTNGAVDLAIPNAPPVGQNLTIEFYMHPQGDSDAPNPILIESQEIGPDGRVEMELPAGVPLFEVLRRTDGRIALGRDGQVFHVGGMNFGNAGTEAKCVGCHAGHSRLEVPADPSWTNIASSATVTASSVLSGRVPGTRFFAVFSPASLVDRKTLPIASEWAAQPFENDAEPWFRLRWQRPVEAKELVLYGIQTGSTRDFGRRTTTVNSFDVELLLDGERVDAWRENQKIQPAPEGTRIQFEALRTIDEVVIRFGRESVTGELLDMSVAAASEIEVVGRALSVDGPATAIFVRGDANCDGFANLSDGISMLNALFLGGPMAPSGNSAPLCCVAAGDVNDDDSLNMTDIIYFLNHLFRGGPGLAPPERECGRAEMRSLTCDQESACPPL